MPLINRETEQGQKCPCALSKEQNGSNVILDSSFKDYKTCDVKSKLGGH